MASICFGLRSLSCLPDLTGSSSKAEAYSSASPFPWPTPGAAHVRAEFYIEFFYVPGAVLRTGNKKVNKMCRVHPATSRYIARGLRRGIAGCDRTLSKASHPDRLVDSRLAPCDSKFVFISQVMYTEDYEHQRGKGSFPAMITPAYQIAKRANELASDVSGPSNVVP